ncbi:glucan biosynthesis protein D [Variovorax sp. J22R133]|uniref:glucan biosynthesis protein n=1 Tax=Variovorax brevis TaxID=3053503 RepID=UPI002574C739|nr:glucan biosynthesis protein D [Variovorax sp. J22R133]MDM0112848.1 glucan biosynthesis protein D [Variovorax sp. J22R133]
MQRRTFLGAAGAMAATGCSNILVSPAAQAAGLQPLGASQPFDYAWLKGTASAMAGKPYTQHGRPLPADVAALDWDQYQSIQFKPDHAMWNDQKLKFQIKLFHLGLFFKRPVRMHEVNRGRAQELAYDPAMFDYGKSGLVGSKQPRDLGFAGFRVNSSIDSFKSDVAAFLGASYFRAVGVEGQYGLSARGLAVDTALPRDEEFPDFTDFYFEQPEAPSDTVVVYALLDSPSIVGAYRFAITPGDVLLMDIDAALYPRKPIERLGIAPCTSMFQFGENDRRMSNDWRPEIHDSDGLAMNSGSGEWIWRPLTNPATLSFNSFADQNPKGFGLLQRDRNFDHYQDDGVFYEKRPCLWVEPKTGWGDGAIQLVQIPTVDETFDNIVAFWNPAQKVQPGQEMLFGYRLYWGAQPPSRPPLAICVATRTGIGGIVGQKRKYYSYRFTIDFAGGALAQIDWKTAKVEPVITLSSGKAEITSARPLDSIRGVRAMFDVVPTESTEPVTMRVYLKGGEQTLSETWLYEWVPPALADRK